MFVEPLLLFEYTVVYNKEHLFGLPLIPGLELLVISYLIRAVGVSFVIIFGLLSSVCEIAPEQLR